MYTVSRLGSALDKLAEIYVAAEPAERERIATGVEALNRRLALAPLEVGESRGGSLRLDFPDLFAVRFRIDEATFTVRVIAVGRYGR